MQLCVNVLLEGGGPFQPDPSQHELPAFAFPPLLARSPDVLREGLSGCGRARRRAAAQTVAQYYPGVVDKARRATGMGSFAWATLKEKGNKQQNTSKGEHIKRERGTNTSKIVFLPFSLLENENNTLRGAKNHQKEGEPSQSNCAAPLFFCNPRGLPAARPRLREPRLEHLEVLPLRAAHGEGSDGVHPAGGGERRGGWGEKKPLL